MVPRRIAELLFLKESTLVKSAAAPVLTAKFIFTVVYGQGMVWLKSTSCPLVKKGTPRM